MKNKYTVIVTGASGFIGKELVRFFLEKGWTVKALQREILVSTNPNLSYHAFELPSRVDSNVFKGVDFVIHCAVQSYDQHQRNSDQVNIDGTKFLLEQCRSNNIKMIFLSSLSAHLDARSHYGKHKLYLESIFDPQKDLVLKPGLVLGRRGLFDKILTMIRRSKIIPLAGGGDQPVQTVAVEDLCSVISFGLENNISGIYKIAETNAVTLKDLYSYAAGKLHAKTIFVSIPLYPLLLLCRLAEKIYLRLPFTSENILGLKYMRSFETTEDLKIFKMNLKNYRETIDLLLK